DIGPLLAGGVQNLALDDLAIDAAATRGELDADGGLGLVAELIPREPRDEVRLPDAGVADEHHLEEVIVVVVCPIRHSSPSTAPQSDPRPPLASERRRWKSCGHCERDRGRVREREEGAEKGIRDEGLCGGSAEEEKEEVMERRFWNSLGDCRRLIEDIESLSKVRKKLVEDSSDLSIEMVSVGRISLMGARPDGCLLCIAVLALSSSVLLSASPLRGISPQDEMYFAGPVIGCRDGSRTFTKDRLNDGFCDCPDGTDEPGALFLLLDLGAVQLIVL
ncbi:hypothetical protein B296_00028333, partial [Ensete ventricosum]